MPGKPGTPLPANIKKSSMSLSWSPPDSDGGSPITNYMLEMKTSVLFRWTSVTTDKISDNEYTVPRLTEGETYEFRVIAENKAGQGKPSDSCKPVKAVAPIGMLMLCDFLRLWF